MASSDWMQAHFLVVIIIKGIEIPFIDAGSTTVKEDGKILITEPSSVKTSHHSIDITVVVLSVVCALAVTGLIVVLLLYIRRGRAGTLSVSNELPEEEEKYYEIRSWYEYISFRRSTRKSHHHYDRRIEKSVSSRPGGGTTIKIEDDQIYETYR